MTVATLTCQDDKRRQLVRNKGNVQGIDYVEIVDDHDQHELCVHFFGKAPENIALANVRIVGGRRIRNIQVKSVTVEHADDPELDDCLRVRVDRPGDFSTYQLCLVDVDKHGHATNKPLHGFDPRYACVDFSFKVGCPSDLDCKVEPVCPPAGRPEPEINYLTKDYASFRQLILDRLALLMPDWQERHVPDIGITLVELLAYVGDYLSYYQDAVATEAYLDTARQRISVRRHARLVDYFMHEGCNARAWVCVETDSDTSLNPKDIFFITGCSDLIQVGGRVLKPEHLHGIPRSHYEVFEPLVADSSTTIQLYAAHNEIRFYTWGDTECCLPKGATRATLLNDKHTLNLDEHKLSLRVGAILIFEEVIGPQTGNPADADPAHRCAVRLTKADPNIDPLNNWPIVEIEWAIADALPFALCLSSTPPPTPDKPECVLVDNVSIARGNLILVDHGRTIDDETIKDAVSTKETIGECVCEGSLVEMTDVADTFRPILQETPITFSQPPLFSSPASSRFTQDPHQALPQITLTGKPAILNEPFDASQPRWKWHPQYDLLSSGASEQHFVAEIDNDGRAQVRFGDDELGRMPDANMTFMARYRVGNGRAGNVGVETIAYIVTSQPGVNLRPRNPIPAQGGMDPEPIAEVKLFAPGAFRKELQRAITANDYAQLAQQNATVQRASGRLRWTGSWYEARVAIDPLGTEEVGARQLHRIEGALHRYRRMGHDLVVAHAHYVPLDIELMVCVLPHYLRGHIEAALLDVFSNQLLPSGTRGFFHPDKLTFGDDVSLSGLVAAAQAVPGVQSVTVTRLERLYEGPNGEIVNGILPLGLDEIAQLDNDPNFPEHGKLTLVMGGGR